MSIYFSHNQIFIIFYDLSIKHIVNHLPVCLVHFFPVEPDIYTSYVRPYAMPQCLANGFLWDVERRGDRSPRMAGPVRGNIGEKGCYLLFPSFIR